MRSVRLEPNGPAVSLRRPVGAIGNFDGVHLGHRQVIKRAVALAAQSQSEAVVVTFSPHPVKVLHPTSDFQTLQTLDQHLGLLASLGVDTTILIGFTRELASMPAEEFVTQILVGRLGLVDMVVGPNFRFGRDRLGNFELLQGLGRRLGFTPHGVEPFALDDAIVSSTRIREALREGDVETAARLLGRPHELEGVVVRGSGRGSKSLFPTANLEIANECLPARGVYAAEAVLQGQVYRAGVFLGRRRTFDEEHDVCEAHLLDYSGKPLYGRSLSLRLHFRVRGEQAFESLEALKAQIERDLAVIRTRLHP